MAIPVMLAVSVVVFLMMHLVPGDPIALMMGTDQDKLPPSVVEAMRRQLGLDLPIHVQYWRFLTGFARFDFGTSIRHSQPVRELIARDIVHTIELGVASLVLAVALGILLGIVAALRRGDWWDTFGMVVAMAGVAIPNFWLGLILMLTVSVKLGWLPATGTGSLKQLILPATTLGFSGMAIIARLTRSSLLEVLGADYIRTAAAKGLGRTQVIVRHALRNALIAVVTLIGLRVGHIIGGSVVIETVFNRRGIGSLALQGIQGKDFPLVQGIVIVMAGSYVVINLLVDVLYTIIDPRIRYS